MPGEGLESVISGALAEAREEGALPPNTEDETPVVADDAGEETEIVDDGTGGEDETPPEGDETTEEVVAEPEVKPEEKPKPKEEEEADADAELGPAKDDKGKENKIPHSRVVKISANAAKKAVLDLVSSVAEVVGFDKTKVTPENFSQAMQSVAGEVVTLRGRVAAMDELGPIMESDGEAFIRILAKSNPEQYERFLAVIDGGEGGKKPTATEEDPEPLPDIPYTLPDGTKGTTYSLEGQRKREAWLIRNVKREIMADYDKRLKPIEDEKKTIAQTERENQQLAINLKDLIDEMRTYEGFTENEPAIQTHLATIDKKVPFSKAIRQAYNAVVVKKLKDDAANARTKAMEELKKAGRPTGTPVGGAQPKKKEGTARGEGGEVVSGTEAAIRNAVADARAKGVLK